jgi:outer membrane protein OmpA-like peptidoglycan-associated protein
VKSDLDILAAPAPTRTRGYIHAGLGYPFRVITVFAAALALAVIWLVLPLEHSVAWTITAIIVVLTLLPVWWYARQRSLARDLNAHVLHALGATTAEIPAKLLARMPLVLVTGDGLTALFNRNAEERYAHIGEGAIWLRVDRPQDLPRLALAVTQWRNGHAPDGIVLSVVPALHPTEDVLTHRLRVVRQATADATRMLGTRLPGYVAIYQRLTGDETPRRDGEALGRQITRQWYGVSSSSRLLDAQRYEEAIRAAESEVQCAVGDRTVAARAAALASIVGWTQRIVIGALTDRQQPATPWALFGAGWIDCGLASGPTNPWVRDVGRQTHVMRAQANASPQPWPLPQPLISAMPRRRWISPRLVALVHALALLGCAAAVAFSGAAKNNEALLNRVSADLGRYSMIPAAHDMAKRDALRTLVADRDQLDHYARTGMPLRLSFGMYRGVRLIPVLDAAIASYVPPPSPPEVVTLDSMSLFDSGRAQLRPGSTRAMVGALDMIRAHAGKRILVAGFTDSVGNPEFNLKLSGARAEAVRDWLAEAAGIPVTQFAIEGYGDTRPIASNETPEGRARNRRVEITLVPDAPRDAGP